MSTFDLQDQLKADDLHGRPEPTSSGVRNHADQNNAKTMANNEEYGISELMEVLDGAEALAVGTLIRLRDGFQITDAVQLATDEDLRDDVREAMEGLGDTEQELSDLSIQELFRLADRTFDVTKNILVALEK